MQANNNFPVVIVRHCVGCCIINGEEQTSGIRSLGLATSIKKMYCHNDISPYFQVVTKEKQCYRILPRSGSLKLSNLIVRTLLSYYNQLKFKRIFYRCAISCSADGGSNRAHKLCLLTKSFQMYEKYLTLPIPQFIY